MRVFSLSWSSYKSYKDCPQNYLWYRGWKGIDLGNGPGRPKTKPEKFSKHDAFLGTVIQKVIEIMYNNFLWKNPKVLKNKLEDLLKYHFSLELENTYIDWSKSPEREEMYTTCLDAILGYLSTMKYHRLLGSYSKAEKGLFGYINDKIPIMGRADLVIKRADSGVTIIDGKNSKYKSKYLSPDQLRWYALCYNLAYGSLPDKVGWVWYRFPYGSINPKTGEEESGVEWIPFTVEDLKGLADEAVSVWISMHKKEFGPKPTPNTCRWCEYQKVCEARKSQRKKNSEKRNKNKKNKNLPSTSIFGFGDF